MGLGTWFANLFKKSEAKTPNPEPNTGTSPVEDDVQDARPGRPKLYRSAALSLLNKYGAKGKIRVLAVRGYYLEKGQAGSNDRSIWDDAFFIVGPSGEYLAFNGNTDPNGYRPGHGTGEDVKGMATLKVGLWKYTIGTHRNLYPAGVQAKPFTVLRDADAYVSKEKTVMVKGRAYYEETGYFGINNHPGAGSDINARGQTSSLGCQTIFPPQWQEYIGTIVELMKKHNVSTYDYALHENA